MHLSPYAQILALKIVIVICWLLLFVYYSTTLDNTDISILNKSKTFISTNDIEVYNKEALDDKIRRLTIANTQLITDKIETEKVKVNLEVDKVRLFGEKNSLVAKREELRAEIAVLNATNVPIRSHQDPILRLIRNKFKVKRLLLFDSLKKNFQKFFTGIRYY